jgi:hypothetical protein
MAIQTKAQTIEEKEKTKQEHEMVATHRGQARRGIKMPGAN